MSKKTVYYPIGRREYDAMSEGFIWDIRKMSSNIEDVTYRKQTWEKFHKDIMKAYKKLKKSVEAYDRFFNEN